MVSIIIVNVFKTKNKNSLVYILMINIEFNKNITNAFCNKNISNFWITQNNLKNCKFPKLDLKNNFNP